MADHAHLRRFLVGLALLVLIGGAVIAASPQGSSSFILQLQNAGTTIATWTSFGKINCSTGMVCSASGSTITITSSGAGTGVVGANNGTAGALANYAAAAGSTTVGPDATLSDNGSALTYGGTILSMAGATATINTTGTNVGLTLAPNGTGAVIFNVGVLATPSIQTTGMAANTGLMSPTTSSLCWDAAGTCAFDMISGGVAFGNAKTLAWSQTAAGSATAGFTLGMNASSGTTEYLDATLGTSTGLLKTGNACNVSADITLTVNTAITVCTWTLPNVAKVWGWQCQIPWVISAGSGTNTLAISETYSQTPTATTNGAAEIKTTNTNTATEGTAAISASGATTILTSPTITPAATVFLSSTSGTLAASATTGTFAIQMTAAGTTATALAKAGATCILY